MVLASSLRYTLDAHRCHFFDVRASAVELPRRRRSSFGRRSFLLMASTPKAQFVWPQKLLAHGFHAEGAVRLAAQPSCCMVVAERALCTADVAAMQSASQPLSSHVWRQLLSLTEQAMLRIQTRKPDALNLKLFRV